MSKYCRASLEVLQVSVVHGPLKFIAVPLCCTPFFVRRSFDFSELTTCFCWSFHRGLRCSRKATTQMSIISDYFRTALRDLFPSPRPVPWDDVLRSIPSVPVQPYFPFDLIHINFQFPLAHASPSQQTFRTSGYSISGTLVPGAGGGRGKNRIPRIEPTFSPRCATTQTCSLTFPARRSSGRCYLRAVITSNARGSTVLPPISKSCQQRRK